MTTKTTWVVGDRARLIDPLNREFIDRVATVTSVSAHGYPTFEVDGLYVGVGWPFPAHRLPRMEVEYIEPVEWVEPDSLSDIKRGDKVRVTKGENVVVGTIARLYREGQNIEVRSDGDFLTHLDVYSNEGWKVEVVKSEPVAPLEDGYYGSPTYKSLIYRVQDGELFYSGNYTNSSWFPAPADFDRGELVKMVRATS